MAQGGRGAGGGVRVRGVPGSHRCRQKRGAAEGLRQAGRGSSPWPRLAAQCSSVCGRAAAPPSRHKGWAQRLPQPQQVPPSSPPRQGALCPAGVTAVPVLRPHQPLRLRASEQPVGAGGAASPPRWPRCFVCREAPPQPLTSQATSNTQGWPGWGLVEQGCWLWWWDQVGVPKDARGPPSADAVFLPCLGNLLSCRNLLPSISASSRWCWLCHRAAAARQGTGKSPGVSRSGCAVLALQRGLGNRGAEPSGLLDVSRGGTGRDWRAGRSMVAA